MAPLAPLAVPLMVGSIIAQGIQSYRTATYEGKMAEYNADVARAQAEDARRAADINYRQRQSANQKLLAAARARYGASGVTAGSSSTSVLLDSALQGEYNALQGKYSDMSKVTALELEAGIQKERGQYVLKNRIPTILTESLSSASNTATMFALKK